jgi:hypothetical protein
VEAETARDAHGPGLAALVFAAHGVAGVLDDGEPVFPGQFEDCVHVTALAVEVNGKNGGRPRVNWVT